MPKQGGTQRKRTKGIPSKSHPALRRSKHETRQTERCPYCGALDIIKKGVRKNKYGAVQLFYCAHCAKKFLCEQQELIGPELGDATYPQPIVAQIPEADLLAELQA